jgi:hypothetical protein
VSRKHLPLHEYRAFISQDCCADVYALYCEVLIVAMQFQTPVMIFQNESLILIIDSVSLINESVVVGMHRNKGNYSIGIRNVVL